MAQPVPTKGASHIIRFGLFEVDLRSAELRKNGHRVRLDGQLLLVLGLLLERPGELITREELQQKLWPADTFVDFEHSINAAVRRLRYALDESAEAPRFIETLPRRGYRFIAPIDRPGERIELPLVPSPHIARRSAWRMAMLSVVLVLTVFAGLTVLNVGGLGERLFEPPVPSLAVLPVKNASTDPGQDSFADGMTYVLQTELSRLTSLRVRSYQSVREFKDSSQSLADIGRTLKVPFVLASSVALEENIILFTAQLIDVASDRILWSYNDPPREVSSALRLRNQISRAVADHLHLVLTPAQQARLARSQDLDPRADQKFVLGCERFHQGTRSSREDAATLFREAMDLDSTFVQPKADLALLLVHGGAYLAGLSDQLAQQQALAWANEAIADDEGSAEAHTAKGWLRMAEWNWPDAQQEFERAIAENPNLAVARTWYAQGLSAMNKREAAFEQGKVAMALAPRDAAIVVHAALPYYEWGRVDEAVKIFREVIGWAPDYWWAHNFLARAEFVQGNYQRAIDEIQIAKDAARPGTTRVDGFGNAGSRVCQGRPPNRGNRDRERARSAQRSCKALQGNLPRRVRPVRTPSACHHDGPCVHGPGRRDDGDEVAVAGLCDGQVARACSSSNPFRSMRRYGPYPTSRN